MTERVTNIIRVIDAIDISTLNTKERFTLSWHFIQMAAKSISTVVKPSQGARDAAA